MRHEVILVLLCLVVSTVQARPVLRPVQAFDLSELVRVVPLRGRGAARGAAIGRWRLPPAPMAVGVGAREVLRIPAAQETRRHSFWLRPHEIRVAAKDVARWEEAFRENDEAITEVVPDSIDVGSLKILHTVIGHVGVERISGRWLEEKKSGYNAVLVDWRPDMGESDAGWFEAGFPVAYPACHSQCGLFSNGTGRFDA